MKTQLYKKLIKSVALGIAVISVTSCNDYLDITPPSEVSPETYLWTSEQLASYTINYYATTDAYNSTSDKHGGKIPSHWGTGGETFYFNDLATDNAVGRSGNGRYIKDEWTTGSSGGYWNFEQIRQINFYLNTVVPRYEAGQITGTEASVKHYIGEGYFLRALDYFYRLVNLGDFPIVTETLPDDEELLIESSKRNPRNEVARFILSDLDKAIDLLLDSAPDGGAKNRITKNAALLLKARVALFEATWEKYHAGTAFVPNGPNWPGAEKDYNANYQFPSGSLEGEINFFLDEAMKASSAVADVLKLTENNKVNRQKPSDAINPYYDMFAAENQSGYQEVIMWRQYSTLAEHWYNHYLYGGGNKGYTHQFEQVFLMENGLPVYASGSQYAGDDKIEDTKKNRDWRWQLFMKAPGEVKALENASPLEYFPTTPAIYISDGKTGTSTGYLLGKGYSHNYNMQNPGKDHTGCVIFRAAEAYLIYIEASYLKNGSIDSKADTYWRALRARAGVDTDYNKTIAATIMAKEAENDWGAYSKGQLVDPTLYNIRRERRCEFIGEGMRYHDLLRWRAMDQLNGFHLEGAKVWGPMYSDFDATDKEGNSINYLDQNVGKTISSKSVSLYQRPLQAVVANNNYYNGFSFYAPHYLSPIANKHFLQTASDRTTPSLSVIYQNPGWSLNAGEAPKY